MPRVMIDKNMVDLESAESWAKANDVEYTVTETSGASDRRSIAYAFEFPAVQMSVKFHQAFGGNLLIYTDTACI